MLIAGVVPPLETIGLVPVTEVNQNGVIKYSLEEYMEIAGVTPEDFSKG